MSNARSPLQSAIAFTVSGSCPIEDELNPNRLLDEKEERRVSKFDLYMLLGV